MKKLLVVLCFALLAGYYTTQKPVATMTDGELRNAYLDTQVEILTNETLEKDTSVCKNTLKLRH